MDHHCLARAAIGGPLGRPGGRIQSIDLSVDAAEKLLPPLIDFVRMSKNATTSCWTGAITANPKIAERGHVSSELDERGDIIPRTEHHALYIKPEELDDVISVLGAARTRLRRRSDGKYPHKKCGGFVTAHDEPSSVPGLLDTHFTCENCGRLGADVYEEIDWP